MANRESGDWKAVSHGNEWEVVTLTESTYNSDSCSDGSIGGLESTNDSKESDENEIPKMMVMSGHFVFPSENSQESPLESGNCDVIETKPIDPSQTFVEEETIGTIEKEDWNTKKLKDEMHGVQFLNELGTSLSIHDAEYGKGKDFEGLSLIKEETNIYHISKLQSLNVEAQQKYHETSFKTFQGKDEINESTECNERAITPDKRDMIVTESFASPMPFDEYNESGLPCEAWWKRSPSSWYTRAKEANAFWSLFVAAALMGLVILGQQWQKENLQLHQINWKLIVNSEKIWVIGPLTRFKHILLGRHHQQVPVIRVSAISQ